MAVHYFLRDVALLNVVEKY